MKKFLFISWAVVTALLVATVVAFSVAESKGLTLVELFKNI